MLGLLSNAKHTLETIQNKVQGWKKKKNPSSFVPLIAKDISRIMEKRMDYQIRRVTSSSQIFEVSGVGEKACKTYCVDPGQVGNTRRHPCTCMHWRDMARPCLHAILVMKTYVDVSVRTEYFDRRYLSSTYEDVLQLDINLVHESELRQVGNDIILGIDGSPCLLDFNKSMKHLKKKEKRGKSAMESSSTKKKKGNAAKPTG